MRLVSLRLAPYGSLTDLTLELAPGVTVIHGSNEAGKSTVLSAYSDLLCGISRQTPMAFRAPRKDLRIHATITLDDGTSASVTRTTLNSPRDLLDRATKEPVSAALRAALTSNLDDATLRARFGLDHDRLVAGGRDLVAGRGDLAPIVFEARAGADVRGLVDRLQEQTEALYKPRKNSPSRLGDAQRRRLDLEQKLTSTMATAEAVETAARLRDQADEQLSERRGDAAAARVEHARIDRLAGSWPFWEQYQACSRELNAIDAEGTRLTAAHLLAVATAQSRLAEIAPAIADARVTAAKAEADRRALLVDEALMAQQPAVDTLVRKRPAADESRARVDVLLAELEGQRRRIVGLLAELGVPVPVSGDPIAALATVAVPVDRVADLDKLADEGRRLTEEADAARAMVSRAAEELARAEYDAEQVPQHDEGADAVDVSSLADVREARERLWQRVRRAWLHGEAPPVEVAGDSAELAGRFEEAVTVADQEADDVVAQTGRMSEQKRTEIAAAAAAAATVAERRRSHAKTGDDLVEAEGRIEVWQQKWESAAQAAMLPQGLGTTGWRERAGRLAEAQEAASKLTGLETDLARQQSTAAEWDASVEALASALGASVATEHLLAWFDEKKAAYDRSQSNAQTARVYLRNQTAAEEKSAQLTTEHAEQKAVLNEVAAQYGVDDAVLDVLADRAKRHAERALAREAPAGALQARHPGVDLDMLADEFTGQDQALLDVAVETAVEAMAAAERKVEAAQELAIERRTAYEELAGRTGAGALRQELSQATAEVHDLIEEWAVARIMGHLLSEELSSYLEAHVNPVLERAGNYLDRLTGGRYGQLRTEGDGATRALSVVGADGTDYGTDALSEGTATQLYLALRLAGVVEVQRERRTAGLEKLPLMLDDALVTFDDDRTGETLELLAEIGKEQQVVVFTHHAAVAETARHVAPSIEVITLAAPDALVSGE